jgi:hypothetical protein
LVDEFAQLQRATSAKLEESMHALSEVAESAAQQQRVANEEWQRAFADRQARQLDDVIRAYDLVSARQNEAERAATSRLDALDRKLVEQEQTANVTLTALDRRITEQHQSVRTELALLGRRLTLTFSTAFGIVVLCLLLLIILVAR